jgi:hypothetical protein
MCRNKEDFSIFWRAKNKGMESKYFEKILWKEDSIISIKKVVLFRDRESLA